MPSVAVRAGHKRADPEWRPGPIPHLVFDHPCLDFANSEITNHLRPGPTFDRLKTREWRRWFLNRWGLKASSQLPPAAEARLVELRSVIRSLLETHTNPDAALVRRLNRALGETRYVWHLEVDEANPKSKPTLTLRSMGTGWKAVMAAVVASYAELATSGGIVRVKHCGNANCALLFFDSSVNQTRRWCDASLCGNLIKVREFRAREGGGAAANASQRSK